MQPPTAEIRSPRSGRTPALGSATLLADPPAASDTPFAQPPRARPLRRYAPYGAALSGVAATTGGCLVHHRKRSSVPWLSVPAGFSRRKAARRAGFRCRAGLAKLIRALGPSERVRCRAADARPATGTLAEAAGAADGSAAFQEAAAENRRVAAMAEGGQVELLQRRVRELERELEVVRGERAAARSRIETMSPEVTDSNPYRWERTAEGGKE